MSDPVTDPTPLQETHETQNNIPSVSMNPLSTQEESTNIDPVIEFEDPSTTTISTTTTQPQLTEEEIRQAKLCQSCHLVDWIYTCPRCLFHSCSLTCVKTHKTAKNCNGIRDKTAYVALQKYTESHMMSDYTYLEDVSRQSDNLTRSRLSTDKDLKGKAAENRARMFSKSANALGINFSCLPVGMSRHKLNQSNYSKNLKQIFWSIEVNFCRGDKKERYLEHSFPSNKSFHAFFENLLFSATPQGKSSFGIIRHQVKDFIEAGMDQFVIALKKEKAPRGHFVNVTHVLDSLFKDVLKGETIIEYPIFYIWLKEDQMPKEVMSLEEKKMLIVPVVKEEDKEAEDVVAEMDTVQDNDVSVKEEEKEDPSEEEEEEEVTEDNNQDNNNASHDDKAK